MSHFWLKPHEQALMDCATGTKDDYGYIAAVGIGRSWKRAMAKLVGSPVAEADHIRVYPVFRDNAFLAVDPTTKGYVFQEVHSLFRLNKEQALLFKLSAPAGSLTHRLLEDPTGESWGNLSIIKSGGTKPGIIDGYHGGYYQAMSAFLNHGSFGPSLNKVGNHADPLPANWRPAFVRWRFSDWCEADELSTRGRPHQDDGSAFDDLFSVGEPTLGMKYARSFYENCQSADFRASVGIE